MFRAKPYSLPDEVATVIAQICCFENQLPQGSPTSPIVSNMICSKMDTELQRIASNYKCTYSRYADDLTFSTSVPKFPDAICKYYFVGSAGPGKIAIGTSLENTIATNGFKINYSKMRMQIRPFRQGVTGLIVNRRVNVNRSFILEIRSMIHSWKINGYEAAQQEFFPKRDYKNRTAMPKSDLYKRVLAGKLAYLRMVRGSTDRLFLRYYQEFRSLPP